MDIPTMRGVIDRRILINYQVDPDALAKVLPSPLRPKLVGDVGIGGICMIRLKDVRPACFPDVGGISSENAAHRIAVLLPSGLEGVYIPRRDTSSRLNSLAGGRIFPGKHHHSRFDVDEVDGRYSLTLTDDTGERLLSIDAIETDTFPTGSVFGSLERASSFFEAGSIGYSATDDETSLDGLELRTSSWSVRSMDVRNAYSHFFANTSVFPKGSTRLDCALLMRDIEHEWHAREPLACGAAACP